ncbi:DUF992 domain-containing protein [Rhizobium hidalgonense]|uniref:DUF992 domain-containing protein n=1 Tax=Rhizobium hidalgonense TaxID=1538159 RepID=UPI000FEC4D34|nr:DUF992 domain-containing protein [Rhizobium hidalgonense]RWX11879.1 DUF992 domain-containing protein [Rhizobium hidalgonense]
MKKFLIIAAAISLGTGCPAAIAATMHKQTKHPAQTIASEPKQRLGTLSCEVAGGPGLIIGSSKAVDCTFKQRTGKVEHYTGKIGKLGVDIGVTGKTYLSWTVINTAPTRVGEGALAGTYVGASAAASVGVGLGANALVGGNSKNFALQPLSAETGTGVNVAAGVSRLQLRPAG